MAQFQQGIVISQNGSHKKAKADKVRGNNLKYQLLWFLKEYQFEQQSKHDRREQLIAKKQVMRKRQIFHSMRKIVNDKLREHQVCLSLDADYLLGLKMKTWRGLQTNIKWNFNIASFTKYIRLKHKKEAFDYLRYSSGKQRLLRLALISTVEKRNQQRAQIHLNAWRDVAYAQVYKKDLLRQQILFFTVQRTLRKLQNVVKYNDRKRDVRFLCQRMASRVIMQRAYNSLQLHLKSPETQGSVKCRRYRRK